MFLSLILAITMSACYAKDVAVNPPVICGEIPDKVIKCLNTPVMFPAQILGDCGKQITMCDMTTCMFNNSQWLRDGKVQKTKFKTYLDQFAKNHPQWSTAVNHMKEACLTTDLPPLGVYLNCPAYDIFHCCFTNLAQYALPSQWSNVEECKYPKQYVAACPMCPSECFSSQVPYGSCNACLGLPRSP